jgi:hypothetical protein
MMTCAVHTRSYPLTWPFVPARPLCRIRWPPGSASACAAARQCRHRLQAFLEAQWPGDRRQIAERWHERGGQAAGIALLLLGAYLITQQLIR